MGGFLGWWEEPPRAVKDPKQRAVARYLNDITSTIDEIWNEFSVAGEGIEKDVKTHVDLEEIIYESLDYFCKYKGGLYCKIDREEAQPYIDLTIKNVKANVDPNLKELLDRDELVKLGAYLMNEFTQLKQNIKKEKKVEYEKLKITRIYDRDELIKVPTVGGSYTTETVGGASTTESEEAVEPGTAGRLEIPKREDEEESLDITEKVSIIFLDKVETARSVTTKGLENPEAGGEVEAGDKKRLEVLKDDPIVEPAVDSEDGRGSKSSSYIENMAIEPHGKFREVELVER